jgi:hypothetical protein
MVVGGALQLAVEDRVDGGGFVAAGVADGPVAFPVAPGRAVGDALAAMAGE